MVDIVQTAFRLPKSAIQVLAFLTKKGPHPPRVISKEADVPLRTVTFALDRLIETNLCAKIPNLGDMRRTLYAVNYENAKAVFLRYGMVVQ
jgi:DNA-binding MarR family transcriptional regulator